MGILYCVSNADTDRSKRTRIYEITEVNNKKFRKLENAGDGLEAHSRRNNLEII
jgi:hypothetical protein